MCTESARGWALLEMIRGLHALALCSSFLLRIYDTSQLDCKCCFDCTLVQCFTMIVTSQLAGAQFYTGQSHGMHQRILVTEGYVVCCAVPTIFITLIYFMAHLRYTAAAFFSNFFTVIVLGLVSLSGQSRSATKLIVLSCGPLFGLRSLNIHCPDFGCR